MTIKTLLSAHDELTNRGYHEAAVIQSSEGRTIHEEVEEIQNMAQILLGPRDAHNMVHFIPAYLTRGSEAYRELERKGDLEFALVVYEPKGSSVVEEYIRRHM